MNERLENEKLTKLLFSLALPSILAQLVTLIYNMVDRIYIGQLADGSLAIAGIGLCTAIISIITGIIQLFGRGGAPLSSIKMGEHNNEEAQVIMGNSFMCLIVASIVTMIVLQVFGENILMLFGASENTLPYALSYLRIYSLGTLFSMLGVGMNFFINTQGYAKFGMMTLLIGGIINIILDPIFIFVLNMNVAGAATATIISQAISCIWVLSFLHGKRSNLKLRRKYMKFDWKIIKKILGLGFSPFFMSSTEGLLQVAFNRQLLFYGGDIAVSAMTILLSMQQILYLPMEGFAQGAQPILSYNYGAKNYQRVKDTISLSIKICLAYSIIGVCIMELAPTAFVSLFAKDAELITLASSLLRIYIFGFIIMGANSIYQQSYTSLGFGRRSFFFAFYRKIILLIPLIYILPNLLPYGVYAVILAEPISDLLTAITNTFAFRSFLKKQLSIDN